MCSISRDPRCQEYTICTAVAPDAVFTVRTYGTRQLYGPGLVCKSSSAEPRTSRSQRSRQPRTRIVSQLRLDTLNAMSYDDVHTRRAGNGMARGAARVCPGWRRLCGEGIALNDA